MEKLILKMEDILKLLLIKIMKEKLGLKKNYFFNKKKFNHKKKFKNHKKIQKTKKNL